MSDHNQLMKQDNNSQQESSSALSDSNNVNINVSTFAAKYQSKRGKYSRRRVIAFINELLKTVEFIKDIYEHIFLTLLIAFRLPNINQIHFFIQKSTVSFHMSAAATFLPSKQAPISSFVT